MTLQHRPPAGKYKLTIGDFTRLDHAGAFGTDRTELLDGEIIIMNAEYRPHAWAVGELTFRLRRALEAEGSNLFPMGGSVDASEHDMPLPDIVLTREPMGPGPIPLRSVALIVEVSSATLARDLGDKLAIYARAHVPEYWVVDLNARVIHQLWSPSGSAFSNARECHFGDPIESVLVEGLKIDTTGL
jgi:Uma2 family endonuclease